MDNMIGQRIKARRKELGLTQAQIQKVTSLSSGNLSCIENGKYLPSAMALYELSKTLKCSIDWIITGKSSISEDLKISDIEDHLLKKFRSLDDRDQQEILDLIDFKNARAIERKKLSSSKNSEGDSVAV